ncbi:hypothetical protein LEP1GSC072_3953 [Leptospira noguchii str. Bonito]|nr:hypothetical protein LEP1GSC072_3953 [Leptospira noguchii str. Bonito]
MRSKEKILKNIRILQNLSISHQKFKTLCVPFRLAYDNQVLLLNIQYVDSVTRILKVDRMIGLEKEFSNKLRESILKQILYVIGPNNLYKN